MYIEQFDIDVTLGDFVEAEISFGTPAITKGDLIYDRWDDLGLMLSLNAPRSWQDYDRFGYTYQTRDGEFWGKSRIDGCTSFEDAFNALCVGIEEHNGQTPVMYRCYSCGAEFPSHQAAMVEVREDYGDVVLASCPECGAIDYNNEMFERI